MGEDSQHTLGVIADLVEARLAPPGRAAATASTLRQFGQVCAGHYLTLGDVRAALQILARPGDADDAPTTSRRATCGEISGLIELADDDAASEPTRFASVLRIVADTFETSTDPRHQAIARTARREADELQAEAAGRPAT